MRKLLSVALAITSMTVSLSAWADGGDMIRLFESIEGEWRGNGRIEKNLDHPEPSTDEYRITLDFEYAGGNNWRLVNEVSYRDDRYVTGVTYFTVRGNNLWVGPAYAQSPVAVIESTPESLKYRVQRVEGPHGQVVEYTYDLRLTADRWLDAYNIAESNGKLLHRDSFSTTKR